LRCGAEHLVPFSCKGRRFVRRAWADGCSGDAMIPNPVDAKRVATRSPAAGRSRRKATSASLRVRSA
jgi:hypothetical protein